jgi:hypothetical protein
VFITNGSDNYSIYCLYAILYDAISSFWWEIGEKKTHLSIKQHQLTTTPRQVIVGILQLVDRCLRRAQIALTVIKARRDHSKDRAMRAKSPSTS